MKSKNVTTASEGASNSLSDKHVLDETQLNGGDARSPECLEEAQDFP